MTRPDQDRFDAFVAHFTVLDERLAAFCTANSLALEINAFRQPCRYLRKEGNPYWLIDIALDRDWGHAQLAENMEHSVTAITYYEPEDDLTSVWRKAETVAESVRFSDLVLRLEEIVAAAHTLLGQWTPEVIMHSGERQENLAHTFREYLPGGEKCL